MDVWLDDGANHRGLTRLRDASISVLDRGLTVGDGVFETLKVLDGVPFALTRHLRRLRTSAEPLGIAVPEDTALREAVSAVVAANVEELGAQARMRITVTHGTGVLGNPYAGDAPPTLLVTVVAMSAWPVSAAVPLSPYRRNENSALTGVKSTSYAENAIALREAGFRGGDEALLLNTAGLVCECTGSNVFLVIDGEIVTPSIESGCLAGITRELVLEWHGGETRAIAAAELGEATEAFLTGSTRDVWPVHELAGYSLPAPGPITREVMDTWARRVAQDLDP